MARCAYKSARGLCALAPQEAKPLCVHHECRQCHGPKSSRERKCPSCAKMAQSVLPDGLLDEVSVMLAAVGHDAADALKAVGVLFTFVGTE
jgi:hypothetical protein